MTDDSSALLTVEQTYRADALAMAAGRSGAALMQAAGWCTANAIRRRWRPCRVSVLCGPGNNGGDGFVVARLLDRAGWPVRLGLLGEAQRPTGDAALNASLWKGRVEVATPDLLADCDLVVDALFGAGLARPLEGMARLLVEEIARRAIRCVAVDVPSGVHGNTGEVLGAAAAAALTVTFFRKKPGHLLLPGRLLCGEVLVGDIGIPSAVLGDIKPSVWENGPALLPNLAMAAHKYTRGHVVVLGGAEMTGAARLAARAARRAGAGLVTLAVPPQAIAVAAADQPGNLVASLDGFAHLLADARKNVFVIGPGSGADEGTRSRVIAALAAGKACVLDADALTAMAGNVAGLGHGKDVLLTPHEGEFARLFPGVAGDRLRRARAAAAESGCTVLLKGPDTVVAAPDGRAVINSNGPPTLATAGSGDVLAGIAAGLMAQGLDAFSAACAAAWLHGAAAAAVGRGLIAEDIPDMLPLVMAQLSERQ